MNRSPSVRRSHLGGPGLPCLSLAALVLVALLPAAVSAAGEKVTICHVPPGEPGNFQVITVSLNALDAHLAHGDSLGSCEVLCDQLCDDGEPCTQDCDYSNLTCFADPPEVDCVVEGTTSWCEWGVGCRYEEADCSNGQDDDQDGLVDCADGDCYGGPDCPACVPTGDACCGDDDCCEGRCAFGGEDFYCSVDPPPASVEPGHRGCWANEDCMQSSDYYCWVSYLESILDLGGWPGCESDRGYVWDSSCLPY